MAKWKSPKNYLSESTIVEDNGGYAINPSTGEATSLNEAYAKGLKNIRQRIYRIDKAVKRGELPSNLLKERFTELGLGKGFNKLDTQGKINRIRELQYQLGLKTSTIRGGKIYSKIISEIEEMTSSSNVKDTTFWSEYRKWEEGNEAFIKEYGSDVVMDTLINILPDSMKHDLDPQNILDIWGTEQYEKGEITSQWYENTKNKITNKNKQYYKQFETKRSKDKLKE